MYLILHLIVKTVSAKEYNHKASWYICFPFLLFYLIGPVILLSTLFPKTLIKKQSSYSYKTMKKIKALYIFIFSLFRMIRDHLLILHALNA